MPGIIITRDDLDRIKDELLKWLRADEAVRQAVIAVVREEERRAPDEVAGGPDLMPPPTGGGAT